MPLKLQRGVGRVVVAEEGSPGSLAHLCTESKASPPPGPCPTNPAIPFLGSLPEGIPAKIPKNTCRTKDHGKMAK